MKFKNRTIDIMGVKYNIKHLSEKEMWEVAGRPEKMQFAGFCCFYTKEILISNFDSCMDGPETILNLKKHCLKHEIVHAFLNESGLIANSLVVEGWARNEEMVDWIASQFDKILAVYTKLNLV